MHSKNRKLDQAEQKHFGRRARVITVVQLIILGILWYGGVTSYTYAIYSKDLHYSSIYVDWQRTIMVTGAY